MVKRILVGFVIILIATMVLARPVGAQEITPTQEELEWVVYFLENFPSYGGDLLETTRGSSLVIPTDPGVWPWIQKALPEAARAIITDFEGLKALLLRCGFTVSEEHLDALTFFRDRAWTPPMAAPGPGDSGSGSGSGDGSSGGDAETPPEGEGSGGSWVPIGGDPKLQDLFKGPDYALAIALILVLALALVVGLIVAVARRRCSRSLLPI